MECGARVILEGAQAAMLDIDYGTSPYVTSSSPTAAAYARAPASLPPRSSGSSRCTRHTSRGSGRDRSHRADRRNRRLLERARAEYGTTTGRPRRTGWFDAVQARYSARINGATDVALTKFDILDGVDPVRICVGYELDGRRVGTPPARIADYARVEPVFEELPGWTGPTSEASSSNRSAPESSGIR